MKNFGRRLKITCNSLDWTNISLKDYEEGQNGLVLRSQLGVKPPF